MKRCSCGRFLASPFCQRCWTRKVARLHRRIEEARMRLCPPSWLI